MNLQDLIGRPMKIPIEHEANLEITLDRINALEKAYGHKLYVTSGYRSLEHHLAIYKAKGITDQKKIPMKSRHLSGEAVDVSDPKGLLQNWILANEDKVAEIGLWFEDFAYTKNWVHLQTLPPKSGKRFFIP